MNQAPAILKPLRRISPSRYTAIKKCPYRVVLANSYPTTLLPYPPASHLGNVIHECIRLIVTGEIRTSVEFDAIWNCLLEKEERKLESMGFAFLSPLSENVSGYTIKKLQVKSMLRKQYKTNDHGCKKINTSILSEKWLEAKDSKIGGYADVILNLNGYIKLTDFKTGKILHEEGEIKAEYEDQLKLYAYLHCEVYGKYPDELSIIDLEKNEYAVPFTTQECEVLASKSRDVLSEVNNLIEMNELKELAKPDLDNCNSCLYRPACNFYWELSLGETNSIFRDIKGKVVKVNQFRNGNLNTTLEVRSNELIVSQIDGDKLPFLTGLLGKEVAFYNVMTGEIANRYQAIKTTKIYEAL